jgi:hypothetical protein
VIERLEAELRRELVRLGPVLGIGPLVEQWPAAVGDAVARNAWPARVMRDGTLVVHTKDSIWAFELTQRAEEVRSRLGEDAPARLKFVPGPVPEPPAELTPEAPAGVRQPGAGEHARAAEIAASIGDENLRKIVARAVALSLARGA